MSHGVQQLERSGLSSSQVSESSETSSTMRLSFAAGGLRAVNWRQGIECVARTCCSDAGVGCQMPLCNNLCNVSALLTVSSVQYSAKSLRQSTEVSWVCEFCKRNVYRQKAAGINMTFSFFRPTGTIHCTDWNQIWQVLPNLIQIGPYLGISGRKTTKSLIFATFSASMGDFLNRLFLKFTGFLCNYNLHIHSKLGKIRFINHGFITEKPRVGYFSSRFRGILAQILGSDPKTIAYGKKWYGRPLSKCQVWWRSVYARRREVENKRVSVCSFCVCLSCWA